MLIYLFIYLKNIHVIHSPSAVSTHNKQKNKSIHSTSSPHEAHSA